MTESVAVRNGGTALICDTIGPVIGSEGDAIDIIGEAFSCRANVVVIPIERLGEDFFTLSTGIAGAVIQKFVNYRLRLAIVGDISEQLSVSAALRAFVYESNRGRQVWFLKDLAQLDARLD